MNHLNPHFGVENLRTKISQGMQWNLPSRPTSCPYCSTNLALKTLILKIQESLTTQVQPIQSVRHWLHVFKYSETTQPKLWLHPEVSSWVLLSRSDNGLSKIVNYFTDFCESGSNCLTQNDCNKQSHPYRKIGEPSIDWKNLVINNMFVHVYLYIKSWKILDGPGT